jgi:hypothetical protein
MNALFIRPRRLMTITAVWPSPKLYRKYLTKTFGLKTLIVMGACRTANGCLKTAGIAP